MGRKKDKRKSASGAKRSVREPARAEGSPRPAPRFTRMVPVRFEPAVLDEIRRRADDDGRSVSAWIRRAVETELKRDISA